jgi:hypothetical protein
MRGLVSGLRASPLRASWCRIRTYGKAPWRLPSARSRGNRIRSPAEHVHEIEAFGPLVRLAIEGELRGLVEGESSRCTPSRIYVEADRGARWRVFEQLRGAIFSYRVIGGTWSRIGRFNSLRGRISQALVALPERRKFSAAGTVRSARSSWTPVSGRAIGSRAPFDQPSLAPGGFVWVRPGPRLLDGRISELTQSHGVYGVLEKVAGSPSSGALGLPRSANLRTARQRDATRPLRTRVGQNLSNTRQWSPNRDVGPSHDTRIATGSCV